MHKQYIQKIRYFVQLFLGTFLFLCISSTLHSVTHAKTPEETEEKALFYYVGGKIGFAQHFLTKGHLYVKAGFLENATYETTADKPGMGIGMFGGVGYKFTSGIGIRGELEYMYRPPTEMTTSFFGTSELSTQIYTVLLNTYLEYYITNNFTIHAGVGIGVGIIQPQIHSEPSLYHKLDAKPTFAWQAGIGLGYRITKDIFTELQVRYVDISTYNNTFANGTSIGKFPLSTVEVLANIGYRW